jgi:hypothetical protein
MARLSVGIFINDIDELFTIVLKTFVETFELFLYCILLVYVFDKCYNIVHEMSSINTF